MDHLRRKTIRCEQVATIILDEADEMLDMGFREDIETILEYIPGAHQTVLFQQRCQSRFWRLRENISTMRLLLRL